jgi:tRNA G18 (ribose-2'-O)-methylase SpoU
MIVRTHVAFGGQEVVFVGSERPWEFRKQSQVFSRKLEKLCELVFIETDEEFFSWCADRQLSTVALEISSDSSPLRNFQFPDRTALVVGNEGKGLTGEFMARCDHRILIPQYGQVGCLNVAVSCSIALYEISRSATNPQPVHGSSFVVRDGTGAEPQHG